MKKSVNWQVALGLFLVGISAVIYTIHYIIFKDARLLIRDFIEYTAFFFIQIMFATLIIDKLLNYREKRAMLKKMNMAIGLFYSEVGMELLRKFAAMDPGVSSIANKFMVSSNWTDKEFLAVSRWAEKYECAVNISGADMEGLKAFLFSKRQFLLSLLNNPNLLEHETFTNLLWAVFHLLEEVSSRKDIKVLPPKDAAHIAGDIKRAYSLAILEWLAYMKHLKSDYPYLFSLAIRMNPFDPDRSAEVK